MSMGELKKQWDYLSDEQRRTAIAEIVAFFQGERDEEIGEIAARELLDMFLERIGGAVYNRALEDAKEYLGKKFEDMLVDIDITLHK